ncbi:MAG: hypothetical protein RLZZ350_2412 [Verrucomicrobiota bacterium]
MLRDGLPLKGARSNATYPACLPWRGRAHWNPARKHLLWGEALSAVGLLVQLGLASAAAMSWFNGYISGE